MLKNYFGVLALGILLLCLSCNSDDSITPLPVEANADSISLPQNTSVEISIYANDNNIPTNGELALSTPQLGTLQILDPNNSPNNPSDDIIIYTPNPNVVGADEFEYTVCSSSGDCDSAIVSLTISSTTTIAFNLEAMPYPTLSDYRFFEGNLKDLNPSFGVLPYSLNSKLFSDYAKKKRFVWMPNNSKATYVNDNRHLEFPIGAIIIKNFYYENVLPSNDTKIVETRLMIKKSEGWVFANYVWNNEQDEAFFDLDGSSVNIEWVENGVTNVVDYRIPSGSECFTCHKIMETAKPIGPKPRNLNRIYNYSDGEMNQLNKWIQFGYLENNIPSEISTMPDYNDTSQTLDLRVRAYLDINCAHCHSEETHCAYRPLRLDFSDTNTYTNMGVCVDPDTDLGQDLGHIIEPGDSRASVLHFRVNSIEPSMRMPLLGRTLMHSEGVALIEEWIDSLNTECN